MERFWINLAYALCDVGLYRQTPYIYIYISTFICFITYTISIISKLAFPITILQNIMCKCANWGTLSPRPPTGALPLDPSWLAPKKSEILKKIRWDRRTRGTDSWHMDDTDKNVGPPTCLYCLNCAKFGQLILRKIVKIVATRCQILRLKCIKFDFDWGSAPDPPGGWGSLQRSPRPPIAVFKGPSSKGREGKGKGREGTGGKGRKRKGTGGEWKGLPPPFLKS